MIFGVMIKNCGYLWGSLHYWTNLRGGGLFLYNLGQGSEWEAFLGYTILNIFSWECLIFLIF